MKFPYPFLLIFICILFEMDSIAQTVSNPGRADSTYPVTNWYDDSYSPSGTSWNTGGEYITNVTKKDDKYFLAGYFTSLSKNNGSALVIDTNAHTILNDKRWRINGVVRTAIPDGAGGFYIGGTFTQVGDSGRRYLAQININGEPTSWRPSPDSFVNALYKRNDTLLIGGAFSRIAGTYRSGFAMYSTSGDSLCNEGFFSSIEVINCFVVQNDTLIYGGKNYNGQKIKKYNFKTGYGPVWNFSEAADVRLIQLSPDGNTIIYSADGNYIKGVSKANATLLYTIETRIAFALGAGIIDCMKVSGSKVFAGGKFNYVVNGSNYGRQGLFCFNPATGAILPDNLTTDGSFCFFQPQGDKLIVSGKFSKINGVDRMQFAVLDTGTLAVGNWQLSPSDPLTCMATAGNRIFIGGAFRGLDATKRIGFASVDTLSHQVTSWNPGSLNYNNEGKRLIVKGDTVFSLLYTSYYSQCNVNSETYLNIYNSNTGVQYLSWHYIDDIAVDGDYLYVAGHQYLRRYNLATLSQDPGWGWDWSTGFHHAIMYLIVTGDKIYGIGDTRYFTCGSTLDPKLGTVETYDKSNGHLITSWNYQGASSLYDRIHFEHAILCDNRLFVQGYFARLNGKPRKNFACIDINTGAVTDWAPTFPNTDSSQSVFYNTSDMKLYNGKLWFGSSWQNLSDGSIFKGFGAMDTLTGDLVSQPLSLRVMMPQGGPVPDGAPYGRPYPNYGQVMDFIINDHELTIAGHFDSVNNQAVQNFAVFHLNGVNNTTLCAGGNNSMTSDIAGSSYQWQLDSGSGFSDLNDNSNFSGSHSITLQLNNIPSAWYGYKLRCRVNAVSYSELFKITFTNSWTGAINNSWENAGNWSCGFVPDANTDVTVNSGTVEIQSNATVHSLTMNSGVDLTVAAGYTLTVLH